MRILGKILARRVANGNIEDSDWRVFDAYGQLQPFYLCIRNDVGLFIQDDEITGFKWEVWEDNMFEPMEDKEIVLSAKMVDV